MNFVRNFYTDNINTFDPNVFNCYEGSSRFVREITKEETKNTLKDIAIDEKTFRCVLIIVYNRCENKRETPIRYFIVHEEVITEEELKILIPCCRCSICTSKSWIKIGCGHCFGCLYSYDPYDHDLYFVDKARKFYLLPEDVKNAVLKKSFLHWLFIWILISIGGLLSFIADTFNRITKKIK